RCGLSRTIGRSPRRGSTCRSRTPERCMDRWLKVKELFLTALERGPAGGAAFLAEACRADPVMHQEIEAMLAAYDRAGSFIESSPLESSRAGSPAILAPTTGATAADDPTSLEWPVPPAERYAVKGEHARGGLGRILYASDKRMQRPVAVK